MGTQGMMNVKLGLSWALQVRAVKMQDLKEPQTKAIRTSDSLLADWRLCCPSTEAGVPAYCHVLGFSLVWVSPHVPFCVLLPVLVCSTKTEKNTMCKNRRQVQTIGKAKQDMTNVKNKHAKTMADCPPIFHEITSLTLISQASGLDTPLRRPPVALCCQSLIQLIRPHSPRLFFLSVLAELGIVGSAVTWFT